MDSLQIFAFSSFVLAIGFGNFAYAHFSITNNCRYTVWPAAVWAGTIRGGAVRGGGQRLDTGQTWTLEVAPDKNGARIWARTGCTFDASGIGSCQTGDCGGVLACQEYGTPPHTIAEFGLNRFSNLDFFDITLVNGFNVPMEFSPNAGGCTGGIIRCIVDMNGECPSALRAPGGCNNPCTVFKTDEYCCNSSKCNPTNYSRFFKDRCPDAYSYPLDDQTSTFVCPSGTNYKVVFCPDGLSTFGKTSL